MPDSQPASPRTSTGTAPLRVLVVGGSLGGLHAGLVLRDAGYDVDLHEKSAAGMSSRGAGIVVQEESVHYLESHGLASREEISTTAHARRYLDRDGRVTRDLPMHQRFTAWNILYRAFKGAFPEKRYHHGRLFTGFEPGEEGVRVHFADGGVERCDLLVCADGANSTARPLVAPEAERDYAGYVAWRGLVREGDAPAALVETFRDRFTLYEYPRSHILCYPVPGVEGELKAGERRLNWVWYVNTPAGEALDRVMTDRSGKRRDFSMPPGAVPDTQVEALRARADAELPPPFRDLVHATEEPFVQPILDVTVPRMARGRVCLVGDAAFVPRPHTAASTAKACADGFALAGALRASGDDPVKALSRWEPSRLELGWSLYRRGKALGDRSQFPAGTPRE